MRPAGSDGWSEEELAGGRHARRDDRRRGAVNGAHDMGGEHGFGPVVPEVDEPIFHADWEERVLAMVAGVRRGRALEHRHQSRFARENRPPAEYLSLSYYEIWLAGLERLLAEHGSADAASCTAADVPAVLARGGPVEPGTRAGRRVRASATACARATSTRAATRGCRATRAARSASSSACTASTSSRTSNSTGAGEDPQWLYAVAFSRRRAVGPGRRPDARRSASTPSSRTSMPLSEPWEAEVQALGRPAAGLAGRVRQDRLPRAARSAGAGGRRARADVGGRAGGLRAAWDRAAHRTPHGVPIELTDADFQA